MPWQYAAIYRSFGDWLRDQLGRPPTVADLPGDAIAAYARSLEIAGGRNGGPAAPATPAHLPLHGARARADSGATTSPRGEGAAPQGRAARDADRLRVRERAARPGRGSLNSRQAAARRCVIR